MSALPRPGHLLTTADYAGKEDYYAPKPWRWFAVTVDLNALV